MTNLFDTPELFESLRKASHHRAITDDHKDQLINLGLVKQVFGGALMLTSEGRERLENIDRIRGMEKDKKII